MALPFGQTLLLWRRHRGLTQAQLAQAAGFPRPNLCAIERGRREVSLSTLRALALALDLSPGILADGIPPGAEVLPFSRPAIERIADAIAYGRVVTWPAERDLATLLGTVLGATGRTDRARQRTPRIGKRRRDAAWLTLKARYPQALIETLLARIAARRHLA